MTGTGLSPAVQKPTHFEILFFGPGEVLTAANGEDKEEPFSVKVDGNTIVLNTRRAEHERDALLLAKDGEVYDLDGKKAIAIGDAHSIDKA